MEPRRPPRWWSRLHGWWRGNDRTPPEIARARKLIAAIDRGGIPLNPAIVNAIARDLGLEVSKKAPPAETIQRIRLALGRVSGH